MKQPIMSRKNCQKCLTHTLPRSVYSSSRMRNGTIMNERTEAFGWR
jgi:hypothetical protein